MSHFKFYFLSLITARCCNSETNKTIFYTCCTVIGFSDEMAAKLEPTAAPNELLVSVCRWSELKLLFD